MSDISLAAEGIVLERGGRAVLVDLSLAVSPGEALMLRGPNGAGKSSALLVLAGLLAPQEGRVRFTGADPDAPPFAHLHWVGHDPAIKSGLSVAENLRFWIDVLGGRRDRMGDALEAAGLAGLEDFDAGLLSAGQTRRLALARLLAIPRPLWLLDEPTSALDADGAHWVGQLLANHLAGGGLAVIATHLDIPFSGDSKTMTLIRAGA
ncbi:heme ABC exporter ATP-binding protein CcmA [Pelagibacterium lacus]|uniref:Heme ABC exporter ATP-binding protein CcmA n=1 Tax=Pelagibacterium lacus TaxID=2282655 RepID=A0A369W8E5_9HYPH|nr:heme ABC exporter ATP-binding protein CcmA [Pelagibacterium lacus]RDE09630.1 heme ABC exporter ATP-binding protein CcmA [Pelagibacterium lacus]